MAGVEFEKLHNYTDYNNNQIDLEIKCFVVLIVVLTVIGISSLDLLCEPDLPFLDWREKYSLLS